MACKDIDLNKYYETYKMNKELIYLSQLLKNGNHKNSLKMKK